MSQSRPRIMIVDDEVAQMRALCDTLGQEGFETIGFASASEALESLQKHDADLLLTDLMMPEMDGVELFRRACAVRPDLVGVVMTGQGSIDTAVEAMKAGALDYIRKPFRLNAVLPVLNRALAVRILRASNATLRREVEEHTRRLEVANRDLKAANADLESFSYSVSHDLRAPLRGIRGFLEIYLTDHAAEISDKGREALAVVDQSAVRMGQLIDDLLKFSRFSRQPLSKGTVSIGSIVERLTRDLRAKEPGRQVEVLVHSLPECQGDASLLEQVLVNLLSNAFKFTRARQPARIEIGTIEQAAGRAYFVRDNGAGFNMKYADKLFAVFQRLHSNEEFEGTGVGLSIVERIVRRHGGRIWAESVPDQGATFFFTLPA